MSKELAKLLKDVERVIVIQSKDNRFDLNGQIELLRSVRKNEEATAIVFLPELRDIPDVQDVQDITDIPDITECDCTDISTCTCQTN